MLVRTTLHDAMSSPSSGAGTYTCAAPVPRMRRRGSRQPQRHRAQPCLCDSPHPPADMAVLVSMQALGNAGTGYPDGLQDVWTALVDNTAVLLSVSPAIARVSGRSQPA